MPPDVSGLGQPNVPLADDGSAEEQCWTKRDETLSTWGTAFFDANLNQLPHATPDAALQIALVRDPEEGEWRAQLEIRTSLAFFEAGARGAGAAQLIAFIVNTQRRFSKDRNVTFAEVGARKRHVWTAGRGLVRAYGAGNVFDLAAETTSVAQSCHFLADLLQRLLRSGGPARLYKLRWVVDLVVDVQGMRYLFAQPGSSPSSQWRPELTDDLLDRVARGIGCPIVEDRRYQAPMEPVDMRGQPPPEVDLLASQIVASRHGRTVDYILRKVLEPARAGALSGAILELTEDNAKARRSLQR